MAKRVALSPDADNDRLGILDYWYTRLGHKQYSVNLDKKFRQAFRLFASLGTYLKTGKASEQVFVGESPSKNGELPGGAMEAKTMDIVDIKSRIHEGIEAIEDADFLLALEQTIHMKYIPPTEIVLTEEQHKALDRAEKQIERGEFLTSEELDGRIETWLGK